jgi:dolichyl-diphosphooligosaccharide--protein glycosyltransferase
MATGQENAVVESGESSGDRPPVNRWRARLLRALILGVLVVLAFLLRTVFVHGQIFAGDQVQFSVGDAWLHVRLVSSLVHHFPWQLTYDPYLVFPGGATVPVAPLPDWLFAGIALFVGFGQPSQGLVERVCAWTPPVMGALTVLPVYFIGRRLFGWAAGLLAAGWLAIAPGHFLGRSLLGYPDHHVSEVFFSTLLLWTLVAALPFARQRGATIARLRSLEGAAVLTKMLGIGAGVALSAYLLSWVGGSMLVGILVVWLVVQITVDHFRRRHSEDIGVVVLPMLVVALLLILPLGTTPGGFRYHRLALVGGIVTAAALLGVSALARRYRMPRAAFPVLVLGLGAAGIALLGVFLPDTLNGVLGQFGRFTASHAKLTIAETVPLLRGPDGGWSLAPAWEQYGAGIFIALIALAAVLVRGIRRDEPATVLLAVWSVGILAATLGQNRFGYYFAVNVALLSGFFTSSVLKWAWSGAARRAETPPTPLPPAGKRKRGRKAPARALSTPVRPGTGGRVHLWLLCVVVLGGLYIPNIPLAWARAGRAFTPGDEWMAALTWIRENTPEPFGDPEAYTTRHPQPAAGSRFDSPDGAYGILTWWEYGYWMMHAGRRIPSANGAQRGIDETAQFLVAQSPAAGSAILSELGLRYVLLDGSLPMWEQPDKSLVGKALGLAGWAGLPGTAFLELVYGRDKQGRELPFYVFYPEYYRTMLLRLYVYRGREYYPEKLYVMVYRDGRGPDGTPRKEVLEMRPFTDFAAAERFVATQPAGTARLVGVDPYRSCVPILERLDRYRLVYRSQLVQGAPLGQAISRIELYAYDAPVGADDQLP